MKELPICSVSGGKDSTLLYCLMVEYFGMDFLPVFMNTTHEHPVTVNYVRNLHVMAGGPPVVILEPDFSKGLEMKRRRLLQARNAESVDQAREWYHQSFKMKPTGDKFLDLMLWKGRAPSTKAQFCTEHLKLWPLKFYLMKHYSDRKWVMFTGIRAGESTNRSKKQPFSVNPFYDCDQVFPLLYESEESVFEYLRQKGVPPNPLYGLGQKRVGCYPCIHARKDELALLPDWVWDKLIHWESVLAKNFFAPGTVPGIHIPTVEQVRDWCRTSRGGRQFDMFRQAPADAPSCMTDWSICE